MNYYTEQKNLTSLFLGGLFAAVVLQGILWGALIWIAIHFICKLW